MGLKLLCEPRYTARAEMDQQTKQSNFIKKATKKHSNLYDYTKVLYTDAHATITETKETFTRTIIDIEWDDR